MLTNGQKNDSNGSETRFWEKISLIAEISAACRRLKPTAPAFDEVLGLIQVIIPFDAGSLYLTDEGTDNYHLHTSVQETVELPAAVLRRDKTGEKNPNRGTTGPQLIVPPTTKNEIGPEEKTFAAIIVAPLCVDGATIGFLNLASYHPHALSERQLKLVAIVADQLAISIERLEYVAEIETRHSALRISHDQLRSDHARMVAEEKLSAISELAATINHQINNPLSIIVGNAECLALEEAGVSSRGKDRLKRVIDAALKIGRINRRLLSIPAMVGDKSPAASALGSPAETFSG